jgi:hypothetical protein
MNNKNVPPVVRRILSNRDEILYHLSRENRTIEQEYNLVLNKQSKLPKRLRDFIIQYYEVQSTQLPNETDSPIPQWKILPRSN